MMSFSDQIRIIRQRMFLSQEAFANELKVSLTTVNRWETGRSKPNLNAMKHIKKFCEVHDMPYQPLEESWLSLNHPESDRKGGSD